MMCVVRDISPVTNNDNNSSVSFDESNLGINKGTGNEDVYSLSWGGGGGGQANLPYHIYRSLHMLRP